MNHRKILRYICILLISLHAAVAHGKEKQEPIPKAPFFCGAAVKADLAGPVMKAIGSRFSQMEVGARLNFRDHYFPLCELGLGESTREGRENNNKFHTSAPYFRVGMDSTSTRNTTATVSSVVYDTDSPLISTISPIPTFPMPFGNHR